MDDSDGFTSLPRGRHHLSRAQVSASQRDRMLQGMTQAVGEKGYARTTVADVLKRARVSRETFYEHFADKQACFLAAYQAAADRIIGEVNDALAASGEPVMQRLEHALGAYLRELAADAAAARTFLLEVYAAGPAAAALRVTVQRGFVDIVDGLLGEDERFRALPDPEFACRMLVGGIASLVTGMVAMGQHSALPGLRKPILAHVRSLLT
ncbi:TetR/AcrR family transcriptional regulator [Actinomadura darangshiensis]|uniref:TetR/AcrR family transcriptional regulator n=1 Tax=Actinomadura darangshiensis TaxID=705336 RepID=A0A4R5A6X9_9ACTN|nr:TetR/AcrR family transcriptional regulator [Actinomadura darangshiensis]TDD66384.1 TetR/AcrR family transcriptional regulator [Actinomadura darangshiensis]